MGDAEGLDRVLDGRRRAKSIVDDTFTPIRRQEVVEFLVESKVCRGHNQSHSRPSPVIELFYREPVERVSRLTADTAKRCRDSNTVDLSVAYQSPELEYN